MPKKTSGKNSDLSNQKTTASDTAAVLCARPDFIMSMAANFVFSGELECASFVEFARHRADRLDLELDVGACGRASISVSVSGADVLVDAFEMACSLGPYNCIIRDVVRTDIG